MMENNLLDFFSFVEKKSFNLEQMKNTLLECLREYCYVYFSLWTDNFSISNVLYRIHLYAHHNIRFCKNKIAASNHEQSRVANQKQKVTLWIWLYGTALNYQANPPTPKSGQKKTLGIISEQKKVKLLLTLYKPLPPHPFFT